MPPQDQLVNRWMRTRRPNRAHLIHDVVLQWRKQNRTFSVQELAEHVYQGRRVHPQQRRRCEETLWAYVNAGLLEAFTPGEGVYFRPATKDTLTEQQQQLRSALATFWPEHEKQNLGHPTDAVSGPAGPADQ
jgi:hypothetical protein